MSQKTQEPTFHVPLLPHDKPGGRPERRFSSEELAHPLLPQLQDGDMLIRMEEDATGLFREDDLLLVRHAPQVKPEIGMILVTLYDDQFWPEKVVAKGPEGPQLETPPEAGPPGSHYRVERIGYVLWSGREWPSA